MSKWPQSCRFFDDHYQVLNTVEEGTYGVVYRVQNIQSGNIFAAKKLKIHKEDREGFPVSALREIIALSSLSRHPNIVGLREVVVSRHHRSSDDYYLVLDFISHDIRSLCEKGKTRLHLSEIKTIVKQLLSAVSFMHHNWYVHRDLKTSNLLISSDGILKVADFGLSRRLDDESSNLTDQVVTLWYRPPEILLGSTNYSFAVDIWSVGCIFGELILGRPLFEGNSEIDMITRIIDVLGVPNARIWPEFDTLPHARKLPHGFPNQYNVLDKIFSNSSSATVDLLDKMLTYDPSRRITANDALAHLFFTEDPLPKDPSSFPILS